jgi:uncharacterized protein (DUF58 family)
MAINAHTYKYLPPQLADRLKGINIDARRAMRDGRQSRHRSKNFGSSVEFAEYRDYIPGDPVQRIDWGAFARSDRYLIRQSHEEVSVTTYVLLDISSSMDYKLEADISKLEYGCFLAAATMYTMIKQGDSASLITFDKDIASYHKPVSTPTGLRPMLMRLEEVEPGGQGDIEAAVHSIADLITGTSLVILISDLMQNPDRVMKAIHRLCHDGKDVTIFHTMDGGETHLPLHGLTEMRQLETGEKLTIDIDQVRDAYLSQVNRYLADLKRDCTNLQAAYMHVDTRAAVYDVLRKRGVWQ